MDKSGEKTSNLNHLDVYIIIVFYTANNIYSDGFNFKTNISCTQ